MRFLIVSLAVVSTLACGLTVRRITNVINVPPRCGDGLPVILLQAIDCPNGFCGYTCAPNRWDTYINCLGVK